MVSLENGEASLYGAVLVEGLSNQEVACLLGIDPAAASKRHGRAMLRLHHILFEEGMTVEAVFAELDALGNSGATWRDGTTRGCAAPTSGAGRWAGATSTCARSPTCSSPSTLKIACSSCNLRELCLPLGISSSEMERLDTLVDMRRSVRHGEKLFRIGDPFTALYAVRTGFDQFHYAIAVLSCDDRAHVRLLLAIGRAHFNFSRRFDERRQNGFFRAANDDCR